MKNWIKKLKIDTQDKHLLNEYSWHMDKAKGYLKTGIPKLKNGRLIKHSTLYIHRLILNAPDRIIVDHINGNRMDNRRSNLRLVTPQQHSFNRDTKTINKTGVKGVSFFRNRYHVRKKKNGKQYHIGCYKTLREAKKASIVADKKFFGKYSRFWEHT